jgi:hypothetical protein
LKEKREEFEATRFSKDEELSGLTDTFHDSLAAKLVDFHATTHTTNDTHNTNRHDLQATVDKAGLTQNRNIAIVREQKNAEIDRLGTENTQLSKEIV